MVKVLRKKDGHINEVPEHVANDKKAMERYGYIKLDQEIKKPELLTFEVTKVKTPSYDPTSDVITKETLNEDGSITVSVSSSTKIPAFEPKEVQETEQKLVTVFELDELHETVETQTEPKKRGRKAKN